MISIGAWPSGSPVGFLRVRRRTSWATSWVRSPALYDRISCSSVMSPTSGAISDLVGSAEPKRPPGPNSRASILASTAPCRAPSIACLPAPHATAASTTSEPPSSSTFCQSPASTASPIAGMLLARAIPAPLAKYAESRAFPAFKPAAVIPVAEEASAAAPPVAAPIATVIGEVIPAMAFNAPA